MVVFLFYRLCYLLPYVQVQVVRTIRRPCQFRDFVQPSQHYRIINIICLLYDHNIFS